MASPKLNQALAAMRQRLHDARFPRFVKSLELFTNETEVQVNVVDTAQPLRRDFFDWCESVGNLEYSTALGTFRVGPRSFFQVNRHLVEKLVDAALSGSEGGNSALDLYAGVGLFAIPLARRFASVTAVEAGSSAVRDLEFTAAGALRSGTIARRKITSQASTPRPTSSFSPTLPAPASAKKSSRI